MKPEIALGILSRVVSFERRALVREHWGAGSAGSAVHLRFVLALPSNATKVAVKEEDRVHRDLHIDQSAREGPWYAWKVFGWFRHCVRTLVGISFVAIADDDAYVALGRLVSDLRAVVASGRTRVVYAAFEWFSWHRNTGRFDTWGGSLRSALGTTYAWRERTGVTRAMWPGGRTQARAWRGCSRGPRAWSNGTALHLVNQRSRRTQLSLPFPFAKGTLVAYGMPIARALANGGYSLQEQVHAATVARGMMARRSRDTI
eukprot:1303743-Prymnesium_polylepis.1